MWKAAGFRNDARHEWLKKDYEKMSRGQGEHRITGKGLSDNLTHLMVSARPYKSLLFESPKQMSLARERLFSIGTPKIGVAPR